MLFDRDFLREIGDSLRRKKRRILLTGIGVTGAIFLLIVLMAAGEGLENGVKNRFRNVQQNSIYFYPGVTATGYNDLPSGRQIEFNSLDYVRLKKRFANDNVIISSRVVLARSKSLYNNQVTTFANFSAVDEMNYKTRPVNMLKGEYISDSDISEKQKVIVLGKTIKEELFGDHDAIGKWIRMDDIYYQIKGIFESLKEGDASRYEDNLVVIPQSVYHIVYNTENVSSLELFITDEADHDRIITAANTYIRNQKQVAQYDRNGIFFSDTRKEFAKYISLFRNIRIFLWFVAGAMLLMGVMNVSNVTMIAVNERMKEIGIRKALGSSPANVMAMILLEAVALTLLAGIAGMLLGAGFVYLIGFVMNKMKLNSEFFMHPSVQWQLIFSCILILVFAGIISGLLPGRKAARVKPIQVLRHE